MGVVGNLSQFFEKCLAHLILLWIISQSVRNEKLEEKSPKHRKRMKENIGAKVKFQRLFLLH